MAIREPAFLPFAPPTMPRPWTGKAPMKNERRKARKIALVESMNPVAEEEGRVKRLEMVRPLEMGRFPVEVKPRQKVIGKPLTRAEIYELLKPHIGSNRQVNLGKVHFQFKIWPVGFFFGMGMCIYQNGPLNFIHLFLRDCNIERNTDEITSCLKRIKM